MLSNPLKTILAMTFYKTSSVRTSAHFGKLGKAKKDKKIVIHNIFQTHSCKDKF